MMTEPFLVQLVILSSEICDSVTLFIVDSVTFSLDGEDDEICDD